MLRTSFDRDWYIRKEGAGPARPVGPVTLPYDAMLFEKRDADTKNGGNTGYYPGGRLPLLEDLRRPGGVARPDRRSSSSRASTTARRCS